MLNPQSTFGYYSILSCLGEGTQGTVYLANDSKLDRKVALKVLKPWVDDKPQFKEVLSNEARRAARIDSPYVVKVWEYGEIENQPFISYEYITGKDFREATLVLPQLEKLNLSIKIIDGILSIHSQGVIHRDMKPENMKLTDAGDPKIFDFGLAQADHGQSVNERGEIEGTIGYASPEQLSAESLTAKSDYFSLGVILYELFTGTLPFASEHTAGVMYALLYEDPISPKEINPELPEWLCDLIVHLLQKQPEDRPESLDNVKLAIERNIVVTQPGSEAVGISKRKMTVTVVDLKNLSDDKSWDYFSLGFTEDIISELSRRTDLTVSAIPASAVSRDLHEVFDRCRSDFVLTGSLLKGNGSIRLTLGVYAKRGDETISMRKYEGTSTELFDLLAEAATDAAQALATAAGSVALDTEEVHTPDITAYDLYLKGRSYYQTNRPDDLKFAEEMFRRSLEIDPTFSLAHTGLSDVYAFRYMAYYDRSPECIEAAKAEAEAALGANPKMPEAHRSLGRYYMFTGEHEQAETAFLKAVEFNGKYALGYRTLAWLKATAGDLSEALMWATKALKLAPTDLETLLLIGLIQMDSRKLTVAMATLKRAIELGPDYGRAYYNLGLVYKKLGVIELALDNFRLAVKYDGDPNALHDAGYMCMVLNDPVSARRLFEEAVDAEYLPFISLFYLAVLRKNADDVVGAGKYIDQCLKSLDEHETGDSADINLIAYRALALALKGLKEESITLLKKVDAGEIHGGEIHYCMARAYTILGDLAGARSSLNESYEHHDGPTQKEASFDPLLAPLFA